jgi:hypothetical protein
MRELKGGRANQIDAPHPAAQTCLRSTTLSSLWRCCSCSAARRYWSAAVGSAGIWIPVIAIGIALTAAVTLTKKDSMVED